MCLLIPESKPFLINEYNIASSSESKVCDDIFVIPSFISNVFISFLSFSLNV